MIPAHPLALKENLKLDERRQRLLTQYYMACGVGGLAVGVHTTQFEIRKPGIDLLEPVLKITAEEIEKSASNQPFIKVAGVLGPTSQASREAEMAKRLGYDLALVSMGGLNEYSEDQLIEHSRAVASIIPVFGFYLQPAVGGRVLSYDFWRRFVEIPNVYAIKVAAFNRYQTLDVLRAVCNSDSRDRISLYTGNDDNIVADLVTPFRFTVNGKASRKEICGRIAGTLGGMDKICCRIASQNKNAKDE